MLHSSATQMPLRRLACALAILAGLHYETDAQAQILDDRDEATFLQITSIEGENISKATVLKLAGDADTNASEIAEWPILGRNEDLEAHIASVLANTSIFETKSKENEEIWHEMHKNSLVKLLAQVVRNVSENHSTGLANVKSVTKNAAMMRTLASVSSAVSSISSVNVNSSVKNKAPTDEEQLSEESSSDAEDLEADNITEEERNQIADAIANGVQEAFDDALDDLPSREEIEMAIDEEVGTTWKNLFGARRHRALSGRGAHNVGIVRFFSAVETYDWLLLVCATLIFLAQHYLLHRPSTKEYHICSLFLWLITAAVYSVLIFRRQGHEDGMTWIAGYILEFIFGFENILVFHAIVTAFRLPRAASERAIFCVVVGQISFQLVFYMGLAGILRQSNVLPYILGAWLVYVGYHAVHDDDEGEHDPHEEPAVVKQARVVLGDRLTDDSRNPVSMFATSPEGGKWQLTICGLMTFALLVADCLLEVDVSLTKIETSGEAPTTQYLCFSSSVAATFAVPELFFIAQDLFVRFKGLKYGIAFILLFIAAQMFLHTVWTLPAMVNIVILLVMMLVSALFGELLAILGFHGWGGEIGSPKYHEHQKRVSEFPDKLGDSARSLPGSPDDGAGSPKEKTGAPIPTGNWNSG